MTTEIYYLTLTALMTSLFWMPYLLNAIYKRGIVNVLGPNPRESEIELSDWAERLKAAHANAIENLGVFAIVVFAVTILGTQNEHTSLAAITYFWSRFTHYIVYGLGLPYVRTVAFTLGWIATLTIGVQAILFV